MGTAGGDQARPGAKVEARLDPDGLLVGTREVYWWAAHRGATFDQQVAAAERVGAYEVTPWRASLLDVWATASGAERMRLRIGWPQYAGAMLMHQAKGITGVIELLDALEADVADLEARRRSTFQRVLHG